MHLGSCTRRAPWLGNSPIYWIGKPSRQPAHPRPSQSNPTHEARSDAVQGNGLQIGIFSSRPPPDLGQVSVPRVPLVVM